VIRTAAGGSVTKEDLDERTSSHPDREALGGIIDVYIEQLCFYITIAVDF
jgi:hypothetical protein